MLPIGRIIGGNPARLFSPDEHDELSMVQPELDFVGMVYGVPPGMARQAKSYVVHAGDRVLSDSKIDDQSRFA